MSNADPTGETSGASHDLVGEVEAVCCDSCGDPQIAEDDGDGYGVLGCGFYLWKRGDTVHLERVPLCCSCAYAIGASALARWETEEEEG